MEILQNHFIVTDLDGMRQDNGKYEHVLKNLGISDSDDHHFLDMITEIFSYRHEQTHNKLE